MKQLTALYKAFVGFAPKSVEPLTGSGSNRQYYRFTSDVGRSLIGVIGTSYEENEAFITLAQHFEAKGLPVPLVLAISVDKMRYLQQDLGSRSLFDALRPAREAGGNYGETEKELLRRTIAQLPRFQVLGGQDLDFRVCYPQPAMDETNVLFDLNYFKYCFLKATGIDFHELRLERDFRQFAKDLLADLGDSSTFLYRDFQARNVMLDAADNPYFIDFQGGRRGPLQYDLASFLWQASAHYSPELREELIGVYLDNLHSFMEVDESEFRSRLRLFVLFRTLQVLGAYGFRGYFERKQHFLDSIPPALENLRELLKVEDSCPYGELRRVLERIDQDSLDPPPALPVREGVVTIAGRALGGKINSSVTHPADTSSSAHPSDASSTMHPSDASSTMHPADTSSSAHPADASSSVHPSDTSSSAYPADARSVHSAPSLKGRAGGESRSRSLTVRIFSFSYKRGIPEDASGNGGGYVFDCRSIHNPGRYEPYKQLTGLDEPVIKFLEDDGEILTFLDSVYRLADAHVERYIQRGFSDLMFSFGCTGGQHRSVYCAQHLAEHLHDKYGVVVDLTHREQKVHTVLA